MVTHRFQLLPGILNVLLGTTTILEMLDKRNYSLMTSFDFLHLQSLLLGKML